MVHAEIKENNTGNCIPLEDISILNVSSTNNSVDIINATTTENSTRKCFHMLNATDTTHDHDYCLPFLWTTEYKNEIITYIAGYILRKLTKLCIVLNVSLESALLNAHNLHDHSRYFLITVVFPFLSYMQ